MSLGRLLGSYPGGFHRSERIFLTLLFLPDTRLDFPLPWTQGCRSSWFVADRYSSQTKLQPWHCTFALHFVGIGVKGDKKAGENSGCLCKVFCALLEAQPHVIPGSQIFTCLKLPPSECTSSVRSPLARWEPPVSTCKGENKPEAVSYLLRWTWTGAAQRDHEMGKLKCKITGILPKFRHLRTDISSWSFHPVLPFQTVEINTTFLRLLT